MKNLAPRALIRIAGLIFGSAAILSLGGCAGFIPLYAAEGVAPKLSAIEVSPTDGRLGFFMHEYLTDALARDTGQPPLYRLNLLNRELRVARGITVANVASRYEVDLTTNYALREIATGALVTRGQVVVTVTYDVQAQPYASLTAQQDGERRAAEQAADRVRLELASFFASPRPVPAAAPLASKLVETYTDRLPGSVIQTPRSQASGDLQPQSGQADTFGQPRSLTTTPDTAPQPFSPSQDPNNIQTLPVEGDQAK